MIRFARVGLGDSLAGRVALERQTILMPDLTAGEDHPDFSEMILQEGFVSYCGVPLTAKGELVGVLEIYHRSPLNPDADWLDFLDTLAGQAAIAVHNAILFEDLQKAKVEMEVAYASTLEGWVHALDLRDKETEGHTQRVTELTVRLASFMGTPPSELIHISRGALLHDIGKMGVPDDILHKPGPLTDEEWVIMKKHPVYARQFLVQIKYLAPALNIPYCHHERWDGAGYPQGLKGEQIPLSARIFAVVDVWDALISDRPYRKAWSKEKTIKHIQEQAGTHFDPQVVEAFLELLTEEGGLPG
jgi:HD-GYP domain-containing protein (c-di-GMP phosphodiesterase class II)